MVALVCMSTTFPFTDDVRLTSADKRTYTAYAERERHKGFETVDVGFDSTQPTNTPEAPPGEASRGPPGGVPAGVPAIEQDLEQHVALGESRAVGVVPILSFELGGQGFERVLQNANASIVALRLRERVTHRARRVRLDR
jgi:hypothetical protein